MTKRTMTEIIKELESLKNHFSELKQDAAQDADANIMDGDKMSAAYFEGKKTAHAGAIAFIEYRIEYLKDEMN